MLTSKISRFNFSYFFVVSVFFCFSQLELKAQVISPSFGSINHPIPFDIFGFNGSGTLKAEQSWNDILYNQASLTRLQDLNARVLRYSGGTLGNYWDWRRGWFLKSHDLPDGILLPENYDPEIPTNSGSISFDNRLETFLKCLSLSHAKPMWQMNIMTSDFSYELATLYAAKTKGVTSEYIELGNEFYLGDSDYRFVFPNVDHYAEKAIDWSSRIKSIPPFSNAKIAALGSESDSEFDPGRKRLWLGRLLENLNGNTDIEAIILHQYNSAKFTPNAGECSTTFFDADARKAFANIILSTRELVNDEVAQISNAGMETWITEFNLNDKKHAIHGTWFNAMFTSSMLLTYLEGSNITKIMPHTLSGDGIFSGMYSNSDGLNFGQNSGGFLGYLSCNAAPTPVTRQWELTALGNAIALITTAAEGAISVKNVDFSSSQLPLDATVSLDIYELSGWYFYKDVDRGEFILVNYAENPSTVDLDAILTSNNTPLSSTNLTFKWQSMSAGIWEYALGNAISIDDPADNEITLTPLDVLASPSIDLPPYSITRISINPTFPIAHVDLNKNEFCCHEMLNVRASNLDWSEGYYWSIDNEPVINNDNPFFIEIPELEANTNKNITLHQFNGDIVWTSDFLVNRCPGSISIASNVTDFCPGDQIHLTSSASATFSNPWQYHWTPTIPILNGDVNVKDVYANPSHTTMFRQYVMDGTCWLASNDLDVYSQNPEPYFSKTELKVCNTQAQKNVRLEVELANEIQGTNYTYVWKDEAGATVCPTCSTFFPYPHTNQDQKFTVTVTSPNGCSGTATVQVLGVECCQPTSSLPSDLDLTGAIPATITNDKVYLNDVLYDEWNIGTPSPTIPIGVVYDEGISVEIICTGANPIKDIYINRKLNVDLHTTLIGCNLHIGEEAEINLYGASDLVLMGCSLITCDNNVYTWHGMAAAGENQMIVTIPFGGVKTYISNAETAIDLSDKADFVIAETDFFNNLNSVNLHDYPSTIRVGLGDYTANGISYDINNIYDNTFNSGGTWPSGFSDKGFLNSHFAITCSWIEGLEIGKESFGNDFRNSAIGINLFNSSATVFSNTFDEITQPSPGHAKFNAVGILSTYGDPLNDLNVTIGDISNSNSGNVFNDVNNSIVIQDGGKYKISHNYFGGASITGRNVFDIMLKEIVGGDIEIVNNEFESVQTGIYGFNIYPSSKLDIVGNHFTDPEPTAGNSNFRHTAITLQNQQQFNNKEVRIVSNEVNNLRIGIHLNQTNNAFVINNDVNFDFVNTTTPNEPHTGILTEGCDDLNIIDNDVINTNYSAGRNDMLRGISIDNGLRNTLRCNGLSNLGYSFKVNSSCVPSTFENNILNSYDVGVFYFSGNIGNQGDVNKAQDNVWIPPLGMSTNLKVDGNFPSPDVWYHWGSPMSTNNFSPSPFNPFVISADDGNPHNVNQCNIAENTEYEMDRFLASLVVDSQNTDADQQYMVAERLFRLMRNDSLFIAMNPLSYTQLSDLYYTFINSSSEYLNDVENYLRRQSNDSAEFLLAAVVDTNLIQENDKFIFEVICKVNSKDTLTLADTIHLAQLVHSYSYRVGRSTFNASAITFTERKPTEASSLRIFNSEQKKSASRTKIEPNPTEQCIWITIPNDSYIEYLIIDTQGKDLGKIDLRGAKNKLHHCFHQGINEPYLLLVGKDKSGNILDVCKVVKIK